MEIESISKVNLVKGDVVVITLNNIASQEERHAIYKALKFGFPDNKAVILDKGMKIEVVSKEEAPEVPDPHGPIYYDTKGGM